MAAVTVDEVVLTIRELMFDRFLVPSFVLKEISGGKVTVNATQLTIVGGGESPVTKDFLFSTYPTIGSLVSGMLAQEVILAHTPYFREGTPSTELLNVTDRSLDTAFQGFRGNFFSRDYIILRILKYYREILGITLEDEAALSNVIGQLVRPSEEHLCLWVAYTLVDERRLYENAAKYLNYSYTDGSDYTGSGDINDTGSITVNIGSVFSLSENENEGYFSENYNGVGSDNFWGDRYSFWYKLLLYLRDKLEQEFRDYGFRKDTVIQGTSELIREYDFRSYYDSYPFTLSPLSRGILSKTPASAP